MISRETTILIGLVAALFSGCVKQKGRIEYGDYPDETGRILVTKCAGAGCHNTEGSAACAGLDLSSWGALFQGSSYSSPVIPYRADHSLLFWSVNAHHEAGTHSAPPMPRNGPPLSHQEVLAIKNWIDEGAKNNRGEVAFADHGVRTKVYVANQGCDLVSVFDAKTRRLIRIFDVGNEKKVEAPHDLTISPDGKHLYVSFFLSNILQKYGTADHAKVGELVFSDYSWHSMAISGDSRTGMVSQLGPAGKVKIIDLHTMREKITLIAANPHGCALNHDGTTGYVTSQQGNYIYRLNLADPRDYSMDEVPLETGAAPQIVGEHKPYAVSYFPDQSRYAVTCQGTKEVRVFDARTDSLLKTIRTGGVPQLMTFSRKRPYLFVSCMSDISNSQTSSQVVVIDYSSLSPVASLFTGYQPRGLAADDENDCVWVANRNITAVGWQPHHSTSCIGKNGYVTLIDMKTLRVVDDWKTEVSVDPYCVSLCRP